MFFIINDETAVLPLARVKFCRDKTGTIDNLNGLSGESVRQSCEKVSKPVNIGKITPVYRMLKSQYRWVLQVPYYDFERKVGGEADYIHQELAKLHDNGNVNAIYHEGTFEDQQD